MVSLSQLLAEFEHPISLVKFSLIIQYLASHGIIITISLNHG